MNPISIFFRIVTSLIICCFFISKAQAKPSFDCRKASTATEMTICSDENLAALDTEMANLYSKLHKNIPELQQEALLKEQVAWLAERDSCEDNIACLEEVIKGRTTYLQAELEHNTPLPSKGAILISTGFLPDPLINTGSVEGHTDVTQWVHATEGCVGFIESNPVITLHLDINVPYLHMHVESDADTILIALHHTTFGALPFCSSNFSSESGRVSSMLELTKAGNYEIFVGTKNKNQTTNYTLYVSELQP